MLSSFPTSLGKHLKNKRNPLMVVDVRPEEHIRNGGAILEESGRGRRRTHQIERSACSPQGR
jgi:hypothetical protein